ncbi:MAG: hypothetical protein RI100_07385 [Nitrosarchaeum sp.]|jgi:hypothetical protein|uniref:hypothetical protein n=1 Tax=Nitrosarchaeum sp. TaxID=2026886 RepID=UPI002DE1F376|nr:hypothetical protein [Nitrosarchaeum sp.]
MTEFKIEPVQQVIIHDLIHEELENFLHVSYVYSVTSSIWVDGIIVDLTSMSSPDVSSEQSIKNIKYFERIVFVKYPKYTKSVKWNGGNYELMLRNYNNFPRFRELAKWIKSQSIWKTTPEETK